MTTELRFSKRIVYTYRDASKDTVKVETKHILQQKVDGVWVDVPVVDETLTSQESKNE